MKTSKSLFVGKYEFMRFKGYTWLKIFYHNMTDCVGFNKVEDALSYYSDTKYSILIEINETYKQRNGKYVYSILSRFRSI